MTLRLSPAEIDRAAKLIRKGELVAFPTETVYGLGASIFQPEAIQKIFRVKGRPQDNPLIAHIAHLNQIPLLAKEIPKDVERLVSLFFPGPLTLVLEKRKEVPPIVSGGGSTIALRMPKHPVALALIAEVGDPLVAPSANLSGRPSSTEFSHVWEDFEGKISAIIDGGPCTIGLESTVLSLVDKEPQLLRPGAITREQLEEALGKKIEVPDPDSFEKPPSPGMKYKHYAPRAKVLLFSDREAIEVYVQRYPFAFRQVVEPTADNLYASLRKADLMGCLEVLVLCDERVQANAALFNRLTRAASLPMDSDHWD